MNLPLKGEMFNRKGGINQGTIINQKLVGKVLIFPAIKGGGQGGSRGDYL